MTFGRLLLVTLTVIGAGCRRGDEAPSPAATPASPAASTPGTPAEAVRQVVVGSVAFGKSINSDGSVAAPTDTFTAGDPLFVSLDVQPISPGTEVRLTWRGPAGTTSSSSPSSWRAEVATAYHELGGRVAVRSSSVAEDGATASFAGQFQTVLDVRGEDAVVDAARTCLLSAHRAHGYARETGQAADAPMAVLVKRFVDAPVSRA